MPAAPAGVVPKAWASLLRLALTGDFALAMQGLLALLARRRVRGWNRLSLAAGAHPRHYATWVKRVEPTLLPAPRTANPGLVGVILLGGESSSTRHSLVAALGPDVEIFDASARFPAERPLWLLPIRAGDRVSPALGAILATALVDCIAPVVYWDEDRLNPTGRSAPWIKPDWDPVLFARNDALIGSCVVRSDLVSAEPSADWARFAFATASAGPSLHISRVLTHRASARKPMPPTPVAAPICSISIVIPTRDHADLLEACLAGLAQTRFPGAHEILIVDNGSVEPRTLALFARLERDGIARIVPQPGAFNFAALANAGVAAASGDLVCLLNNDIEIAAPDWIERMAMLALRPKIGAVGARLLYPDGAVQHAGVALGIGDAAGHVDKGIVPTPGAFAPWHGETRTVSAVTAACLLVRRATYEAVGGMDADVFTIDFNDVDLCLRLAERGWRSVYCAEATLIHHESRSRGTRRRGADLIRFERELSALRMRWNTVGMIDPHHSPLFRRQSERCLLAF